MEKILEASLFASWMIVLSMMIPELNYMNASFGFWVWLAMGFTLYHYLQSEKMPDRHFGLKIGWRSGAISFVVVMFLIVALSLIFVTHFGAATAEEISQADFFLPKIYDLTSFIMVAVQALLFLFIPSLIIGLFVQEIYHKKGQFTAVSAYIVPLLFSAAAYCTASAFTNLIYNPLLNDILVIISLSIFAFYSLKYYNHVSKEPITRLSRIFLFSLIFNIFSIISIMVINRVFFFFGIGRPIVGQLPITSVPLINEIAGHAYLSLIAGYWLILIGAMAYHFSEKEEFKKALNKKISKK